MARRTIRLLLLAWGALTAAQDLPPEVLLIARIRAQVRQAVESLPDCTCLETIDRLRKSSGPGAFRPVDTQRVEILFAGDRELFATPGDNVWETSLVRFVSGGMVGNGVFALHLKSIFLNNQAVITWHGEEQNTARYDFTMPLSRSGYVISRGEIAETVAEKGSFWADPQTHDILRLEIFADDLPPNLRYSAVATTIAYGRVPIGERQVLLPSVSDMRTIDIDGEQNLNHITFTNCRAYRTESTLSFDAPPIETLFPAGTELAVTLTTPIGPDAAVGMPFEGTVSGGRLPADAIAHGTIRRLQHHTISGYSIVGLEFTSIVASGVSLPVSADLLTVEGAPGVTMDLNRPAAEAGSLARVALARHEEAGPPSPPGMGTLFVTTPRINLPAGLRLRWKTR
jgi:hypothetical protein